MDRLDRLVRALPYGRIGCQISEERPRRGDTYIDEEVVCCLQDVYGVDVVVVRIWCVIDCFDSEEETIHLVCFVSEATLLRDMSHLAPTRAQLFPLYA